MSETKEQNAWAIAFGVAIGLALATWLHVDFNVASAAAQAPIIEERSTRVTPIGVIDGFEVYLVDGDPEVVGEPAYMLTLTPVDEPNCNIVWVMQDELVPYWQLLLPWGCKELTEPEEFYFRIFEKALGRYFKPGFSV